MTSLTVRSRINLIFLIFLIQFIFPIPGQSQSACEQILKWGIWDINNIKTEEEFSDKLVTWFKLNKIKSEQETHNAALNAGIPIPGDIPITLNIDGSYGDDKKQYYSEAVASFLQKDVDWRRRLLQMNKTADNSIVNAWDRCQQADKRGLFMWVVEDPDVREVRLKVKAYPVNPGDAVRLQIRQLLHSSNLIEHFKGKESIIGKKLVDEANTLLDRQGPDANNGGLVIIKTNDPRYEASVKLERRRLDSAIQFQEPGDKRVEYQGSTSREVLIQTEHDQYVEITAEARAISPGDGKVGIIVTVDDKELFDESDITGTFNIRTLIPPKRLAMRAGVPRKIKAVATLENAKPVDVRIWVQK